MKVEIGDQKFEAFGVIVLKDRDKILKRWKSGEQRSCLAAYMPFKTPADAESVMSAVAGIDEILCFILRDGSAKYPIEPAYLEAAESIARQVDNDALLRFRQKGRPT